MLDHLKKAVNLDIVASGGVRDLGNIESLKNLGLYGAVTGKSLYAGTPGSVPTGCRHGRCR